MLFGADWLEAEAASKRSYKFQGHEPVLDCARSLAAAATSFKAQVFKAIKGRKTLHKLTSLVNGWTLLGLGVPPFLEIPRRKQGAILFAEVGQRCAFRSFECHVGRR